MHNYVLEHHIITKHQSGFQPKDSTVYQLLDIYHTIISNLDIGKDVRFIFCDVSKAFDRVWHKGLLYKLKKIGITGKLLDWITDYLDDRKQKVVLEGFTSGWEQVDAGVPQGSVLGPFLFLIYVNDIIDGLQCNIKLFADDTSLFVLIDEHDYMQAANNLTADLTHIDNWSEQWAIKFNPSKTESVLFSRRNAENHPVYFGDQDNQVKDVNTHTHLGLDLQSNCKWTDHINKIYKKACDRLQILRMLKYQVSRKVLIQIYLSFIRPILEYADVIWDNCTIQEANLLESVQVEAGRIITGLRVNSSKTKLYEELGWEPLFRRREKHKLILMFKIINGLAPVYLSDLIHPYTENIHEYNLRHQVSLDNFRLPFCNTVSYNKSFLPCTLRLWNSLPALTKSSPSVFVFKKKLNVNLKKVPEYFNIGNRKENIIHCQLRNGASNLNTHLQQHHLSDRSNCPHCNDVDEDPHHFFISCPVYNIQRQTLRNIFNELGIDFDIQTILFGCDTIDYKQNVKLVLAIHTFIKNSKRF